MASKDEAERRSKDYESVKIQLDRLGQVEVVNRKLKECKREDDF